MYFEEISAIMYYLGDVKRPKKDSVRMMHNILRDQMNLLLAEAENVAYMRGSKDKITHEDILFLMRKNKMKLKRLLKYLSIWDFKQRLKSPLNSSKDFSCNLLANGDRVKKCLEFLASLEDCDEFTSFVQDETVVDIGALKRHMRRYWMTCLMNREEYKDFSSISQASFGPVKKFRSWLLMDKVTNFDLTDCAVNIIEFLARETIAEMVDFILLMKMKKLGKTLPFPYEFLNNSVNIGTELNLAITEATERVFNRYYSETQKSCPDSIENTCSKCLVDLSDRVANMEENSNDFVLDEQNKKCNSSSCKNVLEEECDFKCPSISEEDAQINRELGQMLVEEECDSKDRRISGQESSVELHSDSNQFDGCLEDIEIPSSKLDMGGACSENDSNSTVECGKSHKALPGTYFKDCYEGFCASNELEEENMSLPESIKIGKSCDIQSKQIFNLSSMSENEFLTSRQSSRLSSLREMSRRASLCSERSLQESCTIGTLSPRTDITSLEDITDISDPEYFCDEFLESFEKKNSFKRKEYSFSHSKKTNQEDLHEDYSDSTNCLSVAARNEAKYVSPIEPVEILEAFARFQEPFPLLLAFVTDHVPRKTKLISLTESLYFDLI